MKQRLPHFKLTAALVLLAATGGTADAQSPVTRGLVSGAGMPPATAEDSMSANVRTFWDAVQNRDAATFFRLMPGGGVMIDPSGVDVSPSSEQAVAVMLETWCVEKSHTLSQVKPSRIDGRNIVVTYKATFVETCPGGKKLPPSYFMSDLYTRRGGRWIITLHTESAIEHG